MRRRTNRALLISFALHVVAMLAISPFLVNHFTAEKERISAEILEPASEKPVRRRVLPARSLVVPQVNESESSSASPASPTYASEVSVPEAPIYADVTPDIVTHADLPEADAPSPVSNTSFGEDGTLAGPVVIEGQQGIGVGGLGHGGYGNGKHFGHGTGVSEVGLETLDTVAGLGIFDTGVMPRHGLIGQVYVPGIAIKRMPDFGDLTPIYTFIAANLDVPVRKYTKGFPTPEMQTVVEDFAIRFRGVLAVDTPGRYTFWLLSDDGSKLYIDDTLVIDNDGVHSIRRNKGRKDLSNGAIKAQVSWHFEGHFMDMGKHGSMELTAGAHPFELQYFQGPRDEIALQWFYQPPNSHRQIVPPEVIYRPGKARVPDALKKLQQRLEHIEKVE
ncbi:MAG: PA14 domain-containing protein [Candidatus Poribacteria bacterium]|nr:PA14 domain-containing protein [Candidatus Poribacteria bacterium]